MHPPMVRKLWFNSRLHPQLTAPSSAPLRTVEENTALDNNGKYDHWSPDDITESLRLP